MSTWSEASPGPSPPPPPWLGHVLDQAHLGFAVLDTGGRILWVNEATALVVGHAPGDLLGRDFSVLYPPAMAGQVPALLDRLREHGSLEIDVAKVGPDGERRSAHIRAEAISDADGSPRWILATLRDLRPQLEQLERMNASALTLLDAHGDELLDTIVRVARLLVGARYAALAVIEDGRLTRFIPDGLADEAIARIAHPPEGRGLLGAMIAERQTINVPVIAADPRSSGFPSGHPEMSSFLGVPIIGGDVVYGHLYLADKEGAPAFGPVDEHVAELFAAHAAVAIRDSRQRRRLEASERRLAEAERIAHLGSWEWEPVTDALTWSDETYRIMGIEPGGFDGTNAAFLALVHPDDLALADEADRLSLQEGAPYSFTHRIIRPDGAVRIVHQDGEVFRDANGTPVRMVGTVQDITERARLEAQLLHAQKMESMGRLAGGIAHDFNNILAGIGGFADLALSGLAADDPVRDDIDEIRAAATRAQGLTRQLLAFSRGQKLRPEVFEVNDVVAETAPLLRRILGREVDLVVAQDTSPTWIRADRGQLEQVIVNLAVNARDAMPDGGVVTIRTGRRRVARAAARLRGGVQTGDHVLLEVGDTGVGMDDETTTRIFEPFFTTKEQGKGTGLGLSTVFGVVTQSGGWIDVESALGQGSTFRVWLPAASVDASARGSATRG